jgi:hypothetical protein
MSMLDMAGGVFRWVAGAVVPMFARPTSPTALAWFLHVLLLVGTLVGAYFLQNELTKLNEFVQRGPVFLRPYWLPLLLLLSYLLLWSLAWLLGLLAPNQQTAVYPDIDDAWDAIVESLQKAGIGLSDTPVIMVLGELPSGFEPLFRSLPHGLAVSGGSPAGSPLRAFANRDAVYVTFTGASLLGVQEAGDLVDLTAAAQQSGNPFASIGVGGQSIGVGMGMGDSIGASIGGSVGASMAGGGPLREIQRVIQRARDEGRPLSDAEKEKVRQLSAGGGESMTSAPKASGSRGAPANVLQNPALVEEASARLSHVCSRIAASRWPLCPVNGAILAVPVSALERDEYAQQWGLVARHDLSVIEAGLKLRFPVFAIVGGLETLPGGTTFFDTFAVDKGTQRLGKGFPYNPDANPDAVSNGIENISQWVLGGLLPYWALKQTRVGGANDLDTNAAQVRFLDAVRRRGPHLGRLLSRAVAGPDTAPVFGGVYLTVVPPNGGDALFAKEFFRKLESAQGFVAWTDEAYAVDAQYRRLALGGYVALAGIVAAVIALGVYVAMTKRG